MTSGTQVSSERRKGGARGRRPVAAPAPQAGDFRISAGSSSVTIRSAALFGAPEIAPESAVVREFIGRVFKVAAVESIEIDHARSQAQVRFDSDEDAAEIWRKISHSLKRSAPTEDVRGAEDQPLLGLDALFLGSPTHQAPIRIHRAGATLSNWRLKILDEDHIRISHLALLRRRDVVYRLEQELATIIGVESFQIRPFASSASIRFNPRILTPERLIRQLERSWPHLLDGAEAPLPITRFATAGGLLGVAFVGQFVAPAVRPFAVLGVALYGLPNVIAAARQLSRGQVGLPALYSAGLAFTLLNAMPFTSMVMAVITQIWPRLAQRLMTRSQQKLFEVYRRRTTWARLAGDANSEEIQIDIDRLRRGDLIAVHEGEVVPVDGVVVSGLAAVEEEALSGVAGAVDKIPGDTIFATSVVRDGRLTVRVQAFDRTTAAHRIGALLPQGRIDHLPSALEAERIANRNAKPALALAFLNLLATRVPRPSQAIIRPDYATAPRLSAQLAALQDIGDGLFQGILFRHVAALERLPATTIFVFDDTAGLERQNIDVEDVFSTGVVSADAVLGYAAAAFPADQNERVSALHAQSDKRDAPRPGASHRMRHAGVVRYRDSDNRLLEIAAPAYLASQGVVIPTALAKEPALRIAGSAVAQDNWLRPLWVLRQGKVLGAVTFRRKGAPEALDVIKALKARNRGFRFVHISSRPQREAEAVARSVGVSTVFGDLDPAAKADVLRTLGERTLWIGDGAAPSSLPTIEASALSLSVAGAAAIATDRADIVLLQPGLRKLVALRAIGRAHRARIEADYRVVYAANLLGAAGGLVLGTGSLEAGLTSNVGTGLVYLLRWSQLNALTARLEERKLILSAHGEAEPLFREAELIVADEREEIIEWRSDGDIVEPGLDFDGI
jgi:cation transport ATPase